MRAIRPISRAAGGFTLIEAVVALAVMAVLLAVGIPNLSGWLQARKAAAAAAFYTPAPDGDTLYVHDLAVHPRAHGQGLGRRLADALFGAAREHGLVHGALVAVLDARRFWENLGFGVAAAGQGAAALATYPAGAVYMRRCLDA